MTTVAIESLVRESIGSGTDVDVVATTVKVHGDRDQLRQALRAAIKADRKLASIVTTHRGSLTRLVEHFGGDRATALNLMAVGAYAGLWEIQSAREMLRQTRDRAVEMTKSGFLYVKMIDE